jgi:hypothetical protein
LDSLTINEILKIKKGTSVLALKLCLTQLKKKGIIFYKEDLSFIQSDEPFEFYFYATKGTITYQNAFPVPIQIYNDRSNLTKRNLINLYQSYYQTGDLSQVKDFKKIHIGEEYVWIYRDCS